MLSTAVKNTIKKAFLLYIFLLIILTGYIHLCYLFRNTGWSRYDITSFYEEPEDSLDVVLIGASNVFRYFNPLQAYAQEGFTSYDYAVEYSIPVLADAVKDVKRTQNPKVIVVDPRYFITSRWSYAMVTGFKNQLGSQDFHFFSRLEAALKYKYMGEKEYHDAVNVLFDFPLYHDNMGALKDRANWLFSDDNRGDAALSDYGSAKGYILFAAPDESIVYPDETELLFKLGGWPLERSAEQLYRDFLSYCVKHDINLLLVEAPFVFTEQDVMDSNTLESIAGEYGIPFLNMAFILEKTDIDYRTDFCDVSHVNILGAEKYTAFLAEYLKENYALPDHRSESAFSSWDVEWHEFEDKLLSLKKQLLQEILGRTTDTD